jgi:hypothetical protein
MSFRELPDQHCLPLLLRCWRLAGLSRWGVVQRYGIARVQSDNHVAANLRCLRQNRGEVAERVLAEPDDVVAA